VIGEQNRRGKGPANSVEMPCKFAELVLPHETTKMQPNLLPGGENMVFQREYFFTVAIGASCNLSIHNWVTNSSNSKCVRIIPDCDMSVRPMLLESIRTNQRLSCLLEETPKPNVILKFAPRAKQRSSPRDAGTIAEVWCEKNRSVSFGGEKSGIGEASTLVDRRLSNPYTRGTT
jgi:hypothetical protein